MLCGLLELPQKDVRIAQIAVRSSFGRFIAKLPGNAKPLLMVFDGRLEIAQQVIGVAQITACSSLGATIPKVLHQCQVLSLCEINHN